MPLPQFPDGPITTDHEFVDALERMPIPELHHYGEEILTLMVMIDLTFERRDPLTYRAWKRALAREAGYELGQD